jgi:NAD-dependent DNA ligase
MKMQRVYMTEWWKITDGATKGKRVHFSGRFRLMFHQDGSIKHYIEKSGVIASRPSKKVDFMVVGEKPTKTVEKLKASGVPTITEREFFEMLGLGDDKWVRHVTELPTIHLPQS